MRTERSSISPGTLARLKRPSGGSSALSYEIMAGRILQNLDQDGDGAALENPICKKEIAIPDQIGKISTG